MGVQRLILDCFAALAMIVALLFAAPAAAQTFPELTGRVVDQANLLSPEQELDLSTKSQALEAQSKRQFVVATVPSLQGYEIEDYGYRLGRHWGIGSKEEDDGVILLVAPNEKKVRIETGYGAEGFLPDILAGRIIRDVILPRFRAGDVPGGIMAGADAILRQMSLPSDEAERNVAEAERSQAQPAQQGGGFLPVIFIMIIAFMMLGSLGRRAQGRRYRRGRRGRGFDSGDAAILLWGLSALSQSRGRGGWGGWGGGGGFGGFGGGGGFGGFSGGGGGFGGGGASGGW